MYQSSRPGRMRPIPRQEAADPTKLSPGIFGNLADCLRCATFSQTKRSQFSRRSRMNVYPIFTMQTSANDVAAAHLTVLQVGVVALRQPRPCSADGIEASSPPLRR